MYTSVNVTSEFSSIEYGVLCSDERRGLNCVGKVSEKCSLCSLDMKLVAFIESIENHFM